MTERADLKATGMAAVAESLTTLPPIRDREHREFKPEHDRWQSVVKRRSLKS
jgi:hypothetical protein